MTNDPKPRGKHDVEVMHIPKSKCNLFIARDFAMLVLGWAVGFASSIPMNMEGERSARSQCPGSFWA